MSTALQRIFGMPGEDAVRRNLRSDWKPLLAACLFAWLVNVVMRCMDLPRWDHPGLFVGDGQIMGTHDAYYWLAAASGVRSAFNSEMGALLKVLASLFGGDLVRAAFFGPALLAGLVGVVGALWGWLLAGRRGAWIAGALGGLAPGFFRRTRLGYYDTDLMTLLMPLLTVFLLALLLSGVLRRSWLRKEGEGTSETGLVPEGFLFPAAFVCGLLTRPGWWFHQDIINFGVTATMLAVVLLVVAGRPGKRGLGLLALTVFTVTAFFGSPYFHTSVSELGAWGMLLGLGLAALLHFAWKGLRPDGRTALAAGIVLFALACYAANFWYGAKMITWQLAPYFKPVVDGLAVSGATVVTPPSYPAIAQSIIEAENVGLQAILMRLGPFSWLAPFGILGLLWAVLRRPAAVLLLPLLGLGLAGWKLGVRFTMFGGPAVAIGLAVALAWTLAWAVRKYWLRGWQSPAIQIAVALAILVGLVFQYKDLPLTPVIDRPHGEALVALGKQAPEGSTVWTWWDYGYVTQFYTGRMTPSDGGQHAGRYIYPTALALASDSRQQSAAMIKYAAGFGGDPSREWDRMGALAAQAQIDGLRTANVSEPEHPQYLVVPWAALKITRWISFFGSWRLDQGAAGERFRSQRVTSAYRLDPNQGLLLPVDGAPIPVSSVDVLDGGEYKHHDFQLNRGAPHLVVNKGQQDTFLMDEALYSSTMVQLLVGNPQDPAISGHFQLVVEGSPHVRIYRVK